LVERWGAGEVGGVLEFVGGDGDETPVEEHPEVLDPLSETVVGGLGAVDYVGGGWTPEDARVVRADVGFEEVDVFVAVGAGCCGDGGYEGWGGAGQDGGDHVRGAGEFGEVNGVRDGRFLELSDEDVGVREVWVWYDVWVHGGKGVECDREVSGVVGRVRGYDGVCGADVPWNRLGEVILPKL
jgi:hypothetical protein